MNQALAFSLVAAFLCQPLAAQSVEERAREAASSVAARSGTSEALRSNYLTPGLSGQPITTVDGARSFAPSIACQKTQSMLEILAQPSATGDIAGLRISQDTDFDGNFDRVQSLAQPISGICANGIVSCQPGSWDQCKSFHWLVDINGALKLTQVEMPALAGCYCINNSCGSNLAWGNMADVLKDLGGGMVAALTTADPRLGIAEARVSGPVITYVAAQATACSSAPDLNQTTYRANPATLPGDAASVSAGNSIFQTLAASPAGSGKIEQIRHCTIQREIMLTSATFDDIVSVSGPVQSVTNCGADCRRYRVGGTGSCNNPPPTFALRLVANKPERIVSAHIVQLQTADWLQARIDGQPVAYAAKRPWLTNGIPSGDCGVGDFYSATPNFDFTPALQSGAVTVDARIRATGANKTGYMVVEIRVDTRCETSERVIDLCAGHATDTACRLRDEDVDGVTTYRNGVGTGLRPLGSTRTFGTDACTLERTRDFFTRTRAYACVVDTGSPAAPDLSRGAYIIDHSTETLLADRTRNAGGEHVDTNRNFTQPDRGSVPTCEPICKTRAAHVSTGAAPGGTVTARQNDPSGWDTFYHACTGASVCPVGPNEEIVSNCACLDNFPEAVVMMQSVRLAGADMVCTSATP